MVTMNGMLPPTGLYEEAERRVAELKRVQEEIEGRLRKNLPGKIHVVKSGNRIQYYLRTDAHDKSGTYIAKREQSKIRRYLQKAYDEKIQKLIRKEIRSIEAFLKQSDNLRGGIQQAYSENPQEVRDVLRPVDCPDEEYIKHWQSAAYAPNPIPVQTTEYRTNNGELVRSKSELNIANALQKAGIPYKYECPLLLKDGTVVYPDFTILDVKNRRVIYWEHRGMMDASDYVKNAVRKNKNYLKNGIVTGVNLVITEESGVNPLGTDEIREVIMRISDGFPMP